MAAPVESFMIGGMMTRMSIDNVTWNEILNLLRAKTEATTEEPSIHTAPDLEWIKQAVQLNRVVKTMNVLIARVNELEQKVAEFTKKDT